MNLCFLMGRLIFGGFFLYNGVNHFKKHDVMTAYAGSKHVPVAGAAVYASGLALLAGGVSLMLGVRPRLGGAAIIGFLGGVSPVMHDFWRREEPAQRMNDMVHFSKNMALLGGALALTGIEEPWPLSLPVGRRCCLKKGSRRKLRGKCR